MSKEAVFTMKLEPELRAEFMAEEQKPPSPGLHLAGSKELPLGHLGQRINGAAYPAPTDF
jgi:hypothetical protein